MTGRRVQPAARVYLGDATRSDVWHRQRRRGRVLNVLWTVFLIALAFFIAQLGVMMVEKQGGVYGPLPNSEVMMDEKPVKRWAFVTVPRGDVVKKVNVICWCGYARQGLPIDTVPKTCPDCDYPFPAAKARTMTYETKEGGSVTP